MLNSKVKNFDCYGEGWLFDDRYTEKSISRNELDLSKFEWNKGYTLAIQHFGVLDPIFGNYESDHWWILDANFVKYVLETNDLVDAWLNSPIIKDKAEDLEIEANRENFDLLVEIGIEHEAGYYIRDVLNDLGFGNGSAICGITDKDYFTNLVLKLGYDLENDPYLNVIFLG